MLGYVQLRETDYMRLFKGVSYAVLALAACALGTPAKAAGIPVFSDQGTGLVTAVGNAGTGATVFSQPGATIVIVNGTTLVTPLTLGLGQVIITSTSSVPGMDIITSGVGTKVISDGSGDRVQLELTITGGFADTGTLEIFSKISGIFPTPGNTDVGGYDFSKLVGGTMVLTDTQAGFDFTTLLGHAGVTNTGGTLGVIEMNIVPEPASWSLLGIGMAGFFAYRRLFKRTATA
jgi:hypothetical protein